MIQHRIEGKWLCFEALLTSICGRMRCIKPQLYRVVKTVSFSAWGSEAVVTFVTMYPWPSGEIRTTIRLSSFHFEYYAGSPLHTLRMASLLYCGNLNSINIWITMLAQLKAEFGLASARCVHDSLTWWSCSGALMKTKHECIVRTRSSQFSLSGVVGPTAAVGFGSWSYAKYEFGLGFFISACLVVKVGAMRQTYWLICGARRNEVATYHSFIIAMVRHLD